MTYGGVRFYLGADLIVPVADRVINSNSNYSPAPMLGTLPGPTARSATCQFGRPYTHIQTLNSPPHLNSSYAAIVEMSMDALRVGTRVDILWDLTKGRRKMNVWWGASIISIRSRGAKSRSATVQYEAQHGYETTASNVCFKTERDLVTIELGGKREGHLWRCVDTTSSQMDGTPSISILPSTVRQPCASHNSDLGSSPEGRELGQYGSLALRVGELEWLFQRRVPHNAGSFVARETDSERR
jgi:hypothetical protein